MTGREWGRAAPGREEGEGRPGWAGRSAVARRRGAGGRCHTVKMSSPPKEKAETRAGHPPAGTAAGSRLSALSLLTPRGRDGVGGGEGSGGTSPSGRARFPAKSCGRRGEEGEGGLGRVPPPPLLLPGAGVCV